MFKDNPVLKGKDAERFFQRMEDANAGKGRVSKEEYDKSKVVYNKLVEKQLYTLLKKWFDNMTDKEINLFINEFTNINI